MFSDEGGSIEAILGECDGIPEEVAVATHMDPKNWILVKEELGRRTTKIDPIPYEPRAGESKEFEVRLTAEYFESLKDESRDIRFERVVKYLPPSGGGDDFFEWVAG